MKKHIFIFLFLFPWFAAYSQINLVPNPSFEEYDSCPTNGSTPGDPQFEHCKYWYLPTEGTADYFNVCAPAIAVQIPTNFAGFQYPLDGNAYAGLFAIHISSITPDNYREYIQTKLNKCLKQNQEYYFEFYVCRGEVQNIAIDKLGALFTSYPISRTDANPIIAQPQIENPHHNIITDSAHWTKISGTFTAEGGECYLTIGNFYSTEETDTIWYHPEWEDDYAYYYIDGITLKEVDSYIKVPNVFTPNNDGFNDLFKVEQKSITKFNASIYNRWGEELFKWDDINKGWDGKHNGNDCAVGVYYYLINARGDDDKEYDLHEFFHLLR